MARVLIVEDNPVDLANDDPDAERHAWNSGDPGHAHGDAKSTVGPLERKDLAVEELHLVRLQQANFARGEIVEFVAHPLHAHAAGERRIDIDGFLGDPRSLVRHHELQRAHIMQAVGELDEKHANVFNHGQE